MKIKACLAFFCIVILLATSCDGIPTSIHSITNTDSAVPRIDRLNPSSGAPGIELTIYGKNFNDVVGIQWVTFDGKTAELVSWSDTEIAVKVPYGSGTVSVSVGPFPESNSVVFTYKEPHIDSILPSSGDPGSTIAIKGAYFGERDIGPSYWVKFGNSLAPIQSWTDKELVVTAPVDYGTGIGDAEIVARLLGLAAAGWTGSLPVDEAIDLLSDLLGIKTVDIQLTEDDPWWTALEKVMKVMLIPGAKVYPEGSIAVAVIVRTPAGENAQELFTYQLPLSEIPSSPIADFNAWAKQAISWAKERVGSYEWYDKEKKQGYCLRFVANAYRGRGPEPEGEWESALEAAQKLSRFDDSPQGWLNAPKGALLFFRETSANPYGHVAIYLGNGDMIHAYGNVRTDAVAQVGGLDNGLYIGAYYGWAYPPEKWRPAPTPAPITWKKTFGTEFYDHPDSVQQTSDGGYIIAARTVSSTGEHIYLIKIDAYGNEHWSRTFGHAVASSASSVQQTSDGGYIIAGVTGGARAGSFVGDAYLVKTDENGNEEWSKNFGGSENDRAWDVQQAVDGGYIIAGETESQGAGSSDAYLIKTDEDGIELWSRTFGGKYRDRFASVRQTADGGYVMAGETNSYGAGSSDAYLIRTDKNGAELWSRTFGGSGFDRALDVLQTADGGYIIAGHGDAYLIKTDRDGNEQWSTTLGGPEHSGASSVQQTSDGGYVVAGTTMEGVYLIKTDKDGNELWSRTFGISGAYIVSMQQTADGGYVIATVGPGAGRDDVWIIKTDSEGTVSEATSPSSSASLEDVVVKLASEQINRTQGIGLFNGAVWADSKGTYCDRFVSAIVSVALGKAIGNPKDYHSGYNYAIDDYEAHKHLIKQGDPPKGAIVYYDKADSNKLGGHVGISDGQGNLISVVNKIDGVLLRRLDAMNAPVLGWIKPSEYYQGNPEQSIIPDPSGDVPFDFVDIIGVEVIVEGDEVFAKIQLANLPDELPFNRAPETRLEYAYEIQFDVDANADTGSRVRGTEGADYSLSVTHWSSPGSKDIGALVESSQVNVWMIYWIRGEGTKGTVTSESASASVMDDTLMIRGKIPEIRPESRWWATAYYYECGSTSPFKGDRAPDKGSVELQRR